MPERELEPELGRPEPGLPEREPEPGLPELGRLEPGLPERELGVPPERWLP